MTALLIDTVSIQSYIFGSNKLKENIGGSYIIENKVYHEVMKKALPHNFPIDHWKENPDELFPPGYEVAIGYIGGGNALVLFREKDETVKFIRNFTLEMLQQYPGIKTAFGVTDDFDPDDHFQESRKKLNSSLLANKSLHTVNVLPFKHGIVQDCSLSNEAAETDYGDQKGISVMSAGKFDACKEAQENLMKKYEAELMAKYAFTDELEKLGQREDKGYIAVVHVDGNGMGQRFINCRNLVEMRNLSKDVSALADSAMKKLIEHVLSLFENKTLDDATGFALKNYSLTEKELKYATDEEKMWMAEQRKILPLRPILVGGDDITFVCEGRLAVHLAEQLIKYMTAIPVNGECIAACAGVAIVHTKYPFYRAYRLAEELTAQAKASSRNYEKSSWLSFFIASSGFSGSLEEVQKKMFDTPNGHLYGGPYRIDDQPNSMAVLRNNLRSFTTGPDAWPRSKLMALRDVLRKDKAEIDYFIVDAASRGRELPQYAGKNYHKELWIEETPGDPQTGKTPYYDMIELLDFFPEELLKL